MRRAAGTGAVTHRNSDIARTYRRISAGKHAGYAGFAHRIDLDEIPRRPDLKFAPQLRR